jgi:hypothetical protein
MLYANFRWAVLSRCWAGRPRPCDGAGTNRLANSGCRRCQMVPRSTVTEKGAAALIAPVNISPSL